MLGIKGEEEEQPAKRSARSKSVKSTASSMNCQGTYRGG